MVARSELTHNTQWAIECLFDLLRIKFDRDGKKALPFSQSSNMLGLSVDLEASADRVMRVGHTDSRRQELVEYIDSIISCGSIEPRGFERLRGRMVFFEGYSFGRVANQSVRTLAKACRDSVTPVPLDRELTRALLEMKSRVGEASPLQVTSRVKETGDSAGLDGVPRVLKRETLRFCELPHVAVFIFFGNMFEKYISGLTRYISVQNIFW